MLLCKDPLPWVRVRFGLSLDLLNSPLPEPRFGGTVYHSSGVSSQQEAVGQRGGAEGRAPGGPSLDHSPDAPSEQRWPRLGVGGQVAGLATPIVS
ncbi:unnamed protein product [Boreogadus saida]